jgi:hypothetical protein
MYRPCSFALALYLWAAPAWTQRDGHAFTWEISGDDPPASSCLFGTMPARDERVFDSSDSAPLKPDECMPRRFGQSIRFFAPPLDSARLESVAGAFAVTFPGQPEYLSGLLFENGEGVEQRFHVYYWQDQFSGQGFHARYEDWPSGQVIADQEATLDEAIQDFTEDWGDPLWAREAVFAGLPSREAFFRLSEVEILIRVLLRGNRLYKLLVENPLDVAVAHDPQAFFDSFAPLPRGKTTFSPLVFQECAYRVELPDNFHTSVDSVYTYDYPLIAAVLHLGQDTLSGLDCKVEELWFSPYYSLDEAGEVISKVKEGLLAEDESTLARDTIFQGLPALYVEKRHAKSPARVCELLFMHGRVLITLHVHLPEGFAEGQPEAFFDSFQRLRTYPPDYQRGDHAERLLTDLRSRDPATLSQAKLDMNYYRFDVSILPLLYRMLEEDSPQDTLGEPSPRALLVRELRFTRDEYSVPFLERCFGAWQSRPQDQYDILRELSLMLDEEAFDAFFRLAPRFRAAPGMEWRLFNEPMEAMEDSLELTRGYFPELMALRAHPNWRRPALRMAYTLKRAEEVEAERFAPYVEELIAMGRALAPSLAGATKEMDLEPYFFFDALNMLLGEAPSSKSLKRYFRDLRKQVRSPYLLVSLIDAALLHQTPVRRELFDVVAADVQAWRRLLNFLRAEDNLGHLPPAMRTPQALLKAFALEYFSEEYAPAARFEWLDAEPHWHEDEVVTLYWFRFSLEGYDGLFLGVGAFPNDVEQPIDPFLFEYSGESLDIYDEAAVRAGLKARWVVE